jgi:methionyl-tRNA synthetase
MPADGKASKEHKVYVWFDALTNYISALDPLNPRSEPYQKYWKQAIHLVGKDILRFHAVYWPTFLMALGLPVPKKIVAHGWLTDSNRKISKSLGNMVDPMAMADEMGVDAVRFVLFREFVFGLDGEYTKDALIQRINSDLANDYGNCVNRLCAMTQKYLGNETLDVASALSEPSELHTAAEEAIPLAHAELEGFNYHKSLEQVWRLVGGVNKYIEANAPWTLAKSQDPAAKAKLRSVLLHCHESLRIASLMLVPYIPAAAQKALSYLGDTESLKQPVPLDFARWGKGPARITITKGDPIFPRLEKKAE